MRVFRCAALVLILAVLSGCSCLPGTGTAQNALDALEPASSSIASRDEIPTKRF